VALAVAKGAVIFERHVGVPVPGGELNAYSSTPDQTRSWIQAACRAIELGGAHAKWAEFSAEELTNLRSLRRGVFAKRPIRAGERINQSDVFFAMPSTPEQVLANDFSKYNEFHAVDDIAVKAPLLTANTTRNELREKIYRVVRQVRDLLRKSGVVIPDKVDLEVSHHYGIDRFEEYGLAMITIVNRAYCKKLIVLLPGQKHPEQYHEQKEETFHVLYGTMWTKLGGDTHICKAGDVVTVERDVRHSFGTDTGVIIEEISSTHFANDSFYTDPAVSQNQHRKTVLTYWMDL
jgi:mannose-6-phosphate isomerase-like protein (cupin superfamily)